MIHTNGPTGAAVDLLRDPGLTVQAFTWLPGDFDPRSLHRRSGWSLWRYRGEHRRGAWTVDGLAAAVMLQRDDDRRDHLRSLRRPFDPGPIWIGEHFVNVKFAVPGPPDDIVTATLTILPPSGNDLNFPALPAIIADDAPTGPIITTKESAA